MITLKFLAAWLKLTAVAAVAFVIEVALISSLWLGLLVIVPTVLLFLGLSAAMWREWRSVRRGDGAYSYSYIRYEQE
ncbi:hypothetical protein G3I59_42890 [Amycolatopsis rubida]|uniref:Uncharacterized protein n=1 Tax=Amycolatopsis rubida TaxID=112413 RepID=A0ABX0CB30_9PSEU|nr:MULTISPECIES: hypothetical protein [Amycolatopsis]MYW97188.1 hypothetical protein [Amycolatopsis rubida]NEC62173.1 hypothetical protein [Amycolatopsis rubida]OAP24622.1 hypothetical protein A4R44_04591 [Amycolatopsis sp. M39]